MATMKKPVKKYAMGGPMTTTSETTKKPVKTVKTTTVKTTKKYVPTAREQKNLDDASKNINMRPPFTPEERKKMKNYSNMGSAKSGTTMKKAKSGAKFDLNKDGKTTFKDVLIGRGVLPKNAKSGGKMKKAQMGNTIRPDSKDTKPLYPTSGVGKDMTAKNGKSMKKCKYGCK